MTNTWAGGNAGGTYELFSASAGGDFKTIGQNFAQKRVTVNATFARQMMVPGGPLSEPDMDDPDLRTAIPWFYYPALELAYMHNDDVTWRDTHDGWNDYFGPKGSLGYLCTGLVIVDGIDITVTSSYKFSSGDQESFKAAAQGGVWPFFNLAVSGGHSTNVSFDNNGFATVTMSLPTGNPQVLGVIVRPISEIVTHQGADLSMTPPAAPATGG